MTPLTDVAFSTCRSKSSEATGISDQSGHAETTVSSAQPHLGCDTIPCSLGDVSGNGSDTDKTDHILRSGELDAETDFTREDSTSISVPEVEQMSATFTDFASYSRQNPVLNSQMLSDTSKDTLPTTSMGSTIMGRGRRPREPCPTSYRPCATSGISHTDRSNEDSYTIMSRPHPLRGNEGARRSSAMAHMSAGCDTDLSFSNDGPDFNSASFVYMVNKALSNTRLSNHTSDYSSDSESPVSGSEVSARSLSYFSSDTTDLTGSNRFFSRLSATSNTIRESTCRRIRDVKDTYFTSTGTAPRQSDTTYRNSSSFSRTASVIRNRFTSGLKTASSRFEVASCRFGNYASNRFRSTTAGPTSAVNEISCTSNQSKTNGRMRQFFHDRRYTTGLGSYFSANPYSGTMLRVYEST